MVNKGTFLGILFFLHLFAFQSYCYGQSYLVHCYSETEGLPSANVYDITQDHLGRIWFATRVGISYYDGVSWKNYTVSDGLPALAYAKIAVDRQGRIWAMPKDVQDGKIVIVFYDGSREVNETMWKPIAELEVNFSERDEITSFQLVEEWEEDGKPSLVISSAYSGMFLWKKGKWKPLTTKNGLLSNSVRGIAVLKGKCYAATAKGVSVLTSDGTVDNSLNRSLHLPTTEIKGICVEHKDKYRGFHLKGSRIWFYGQGWLGYFYVFDDNSDYKPVLFDTSISFINKDAGGKMLPDYRGGLYIGDFREIYYFNYKTEISEPIHVQTGLVSDGANSMFIDFEKNVWIACDRGVSKISSRRFANFQMVHGLLEDEVTAVVEYEPGKFVLGHNRGLSFWDGNEFRKMPLTGREGTMLSYCRVLDMKVDSKQNIWAASEGKGLAKIDKQRKLEWYGKGHGLLGNVFSLWIDKNDKIWVGTNQGLFFKTGEKNRFVPLAFDKFPRPIVRKIYMTSKKVLYIGSAGEGVYMYDNKEKQWRNYRLPGKSTANSIYAIKEDHQGRLLIGTLAGLFFIDYEKKRLERFNEEGFAINRPVYFIVQDLRQRFWFGTDRGVVCWDGGSKEKKYSIPEGLVGQETNRAAGIVDSKGRMWIGTNRGVSIYNEQFDDHDSWSPSPKLHLLYLEVENRKIPLDLPVKLSHKTNTIAFHFRGISFLDEKAIRFIHKLEGVDKDWVNEHYPYNQVIRYPNLSTGRYRFHLKVKNTMGKWSDEVTSPEIIILKPFHRTWWFYLLIILAAGIIFYVIFRFLSEKRQAVLLEKQVEERTNQLQTLEKRYRSLFEESKDVIFISTPEGKLLDINPAGVALFGFKTKEEVLRLSSVIPFYNKPEDRAALQEEITNKGYVKDYELIFKRKDGEPRTTLMTANLVRDKQGKVIAYRGIVRDITQQKRLEQQLIQAQKMEAIGTLARGIAHDFNNILAVIVSYSESILDDLPEETEGVEKSDVKRLRKDAEQIVAAVKRGAELVKQILTFSHQGSPPQKRMPLKLGPLVKEALKLLRSSLPATIEIRQKIRTDSDVILADPGQINQIMMNFGTNAAHAMRKNGGVFEVCVEEVYLDEEDIKKYHDIQPGAYLRLSVSDTGLGIQPELMKHIFDPYFSTKKVGEGSGMGLAVIHGIVKSHGGDISVYSAPGKGTTFHTLFPRFEGDIEPKVQITEKIPGGSERILLVDDEVPLAKAGTRILERLGYHVKGKSDALEALETFKKEPDGFDLVISDLTMPGMTGAQLAKEVRRIRPDIPVILCSGFSDTIARERINALEVDAFVMKPIIKSDLARIVRYVLDKK
ncbi:MAG: response regulator [Candidatus Aminicenantes bacterium]|nr:response regulator [Candidatus Aminicenantes bacterium]NIM79427.1 response regulator [Candidatus Aminicenantes bacterium]NIN18709.1 response regulator [Candidatus Aminicenantes bacterium]NIN42633.1 response regulator [Candidatus Aminicenantes bacterium]NIN85372.1 response regulator [Candidatus Aminicenantes bacterium]